MGGGSGSRGVGCGGREPGVGSERLRLQAGAEHMGRDAGVGGGGGARHCQGWAVWG